jgi:hypothetical protein
VEVGDQGTDPRSLPAIWPSLIACAVAAGWISSGTLHRDQHGDSLLNVLISLQCWTPFVWEQDRFGMLVPLLALPIRDPLGNMVFQACLSTFAGLAAFFVVARYAIRDASYPLVGAVGALIFLGLTPPYYRFEYLVDTSYGIGLSLAIWGLILVEPGPPEEFHRRLGWAVVLSIVAHWVNSATALFLGPYVLLRGLLNAGWRPSGWPLAILTYRAIPFRDRVEILVRGLWRTETTRALVVLAAGYEAGQAMIALNPYQPTDLSAAPIEEWYTAWRELLRTNWRALTPPLWAVPLALEAFLGVIGLARRFRAELTRSALALLVTAVALGLLMGTRRWVALNEYSFRYLFPSAIFGQTALAGLACSSMKIIKPRKPIGPVLSASFLTVILIAAAAWSYGWPSVAKVRRDLDRKFGAMTDDLLAARVTCLAGNYWTVWPAVFHANLTLRDRGDPRTVWGLTFRSEPTSRLWQSAIDEDSRVAIPVGDGEGRTFVNAYFIRYRLKEVEPRATIRVFRPSAR